MGIERLCRRPAPAPTHPPLPHFNVVVAAAEPDALREASYFVERLSAESMPLCGLVANRTHPVLAPDVSQSSPETSVFASRG